MDEEDSNSQFSFEKKKVRDHKESPCQYSSVKKQIKIVNEDLEEEETRSTKANL